MSTSPLSTESKLAKVSSHRFRPAHCRTRKAEVDLVSVFRSAVVAARLQHVDPPDLDEADAIEGRGFPASAVERIHGKPAILYAGVYAKPERLADRQAGDADGARVIGAGPPMPTVI